MCLTASPANPSYALRIRKGRIAAAAGRFADGDVAAIVRHLATGATGADLVIADEAHSVQPGTGAWAGLGTREDTAR